MVRTGRETIESSIPPMRELGFRLDDLPHTRR